MSSHTPSDDSPYWHYPHSNASSSSQYPIPCHPFGQSTSRLSNTYPEGFDINVKVKRAFTFEELQSGAYFNSLDESDLRFFGMYGQPVLIPCPEDSDQGGWSLQGQTHMHSASSCITAPQYASHSNPSSFQISKSYTLVDSLGQLSTSTSAQAPTSTRVSAISPALGHSSMNPTKRNSSMMQQTFGGLVYPSDLPSSSSALRMYDGAMSPMVHETEDIKPNISTLDDEPPMDHLPYPPPGHSVPPHQFPPYSPQDTKSHPASPSSPTSATLSATSPCDASETPMTVPSQSYMFVEVESSTPAFIHTSQQHFHSPNETQSRHHAGRTASPYQRSPSPRGGLRISPQPHPKRSMDKKPALACLFCRGRKIACGPPVPGSKDRTCNQCARRHLKCEYPLESRRGMRKRRSLIPRGSGSPPPEISTSSPKVIRPGRKRSVDKRP